MLQQEVMIQKVRELCQRDERVVATLMYGSFALGQGDRFSDIEFYMFLDDEALDGLEEEAWVSQIAPLDLYYINEFGNGTAIFENLVRGEFHFEAASNVGLVDAWETAWFPSLESAVLVDKSGELSRRVSRLVRRPPDVDTPERAFFLCCGLMNWTLMGTNLLKRGEYARAEAFLTLVHGHLLHAMRLVEGKTANWLSPTRKLEEDVSAASYERFRACTAALDTEQLVWAYTSTWEWSRELMSKLATRHSFVLPEVLLNKLNQHLGAD
ncbi:MAG: nucleotidyltransferase domain-containing protein [Chloroflexota bacterium]|jgi:lincosamide nucleotidyltransferase|nr:nucleotidyltransferase domain-containing protein [Chloroflexota bacterium]